ncbi:MAG: formylglycine-generating enzyme family protein [Planctomycetota bacterium]
MLLISPGRFASGGGKELAPFLMDRFEVTVERFRPFVEAMRKNPSRFIDGLLYWDEVGYDYPTQAVPSEAEWEYAASWDAENNIWRRYPWGDRFDPGIHSKAFPPVVTELALDASPWGVSGMGTGVKEWCELPDFRIESGVIRGASQVLGSRTDRIRTPIADARFESSWKTRANNLGFRCILKLKKANEK